MSEIQETKLEEDEAPPAPESSVSSDAASVTSTTASVKKSDATRPSSLPKPSGLKPPSKIGRLCSNAAPKPAVPISPRAGKFIFINLSLFCLKCVLRESKSPKHKLQLTIFPVSLCLFSKYYFVNLSFITSVM